MNRFIVAGAPCSGKSSYVKKNAERGDLIYDYDTLHQALSGQASHNHLTEIRPYVIAARNSIFEELEAHKQKSAWVITSTSKTKELLDLKDRFEAEIIFMAVEREEAHRRATAEDRPEEWHSYIDNWFENSDIVETSKNWRRVMKQKVYLAPIIFKADGPEGTFTAEFATLNVIDHDGDITKNGAFRDGQETLIEPWNHNYGSLPVGKGVIHEKGDKAIIEGLFFLDTQSGSDHYKVVKNLGPLQEWSYTFEIEESSQGTVEDQDVRFLEKLDVWGVAPVTRGAGIDTRTTSIKGEKRAVSSHSTPTTDEAWDGPANERRVKSGEAVSYYRKVYAWQDPEGDPEVKSSWRFIHHMVDGDGNPGAANIRGCQTGIGVLNGARGGTTIPDADRRGVWNHLAKHLRDADLEPAELKSLEDIEKAKDKAGDGKSSSSVEVIKTQIEILELEE